MLKGQEIKTQHSLKEKLVDWRLILIVFVTRGPLVTVLIYANFAIYIRLYTTYTVSDVLFRFTRIHVDFNTIVVIQSISFYTAVCIQSFGNLWAIRSLNVSIFKMSPFRGSTRNLPMVFTAVGVWLLAILFINLPGLSYIFGFVPIPWPFYFLPFSYALFMIILNELRLLLIKTFKLRESFLMW